MQIFRLRRGDTEHGMSSISRDFFAAHLGETVLSAETEGLDVVVAIAGKMIKPSNLVLYNDLLKEWHKYYEANRYRFDFETHIMHPKGTTMELYDEDPPGGLKYRLVSEGLISDPEPSPQGNGYLINQRRELLKRSWD